MKNAGNIKRLFDFIKERQLIYAKRQRGEAPPWTKDQILGVYRFCNVYREQDVVTRWIAKNWRAPHKGERELWFGMVVARLFNLPLTLETLNWPVPWTTKFSANVIRALQARQAHNINVFNAAYIVSTNGKSMDKVEYVVREVLDPIWKKRDDITAVLSAVEPPTLAQAHAVLTQFNGLGGFLAAQVIADLKYVEPLKRATDWWTWAASGPGSRRGLNRVCGHDVQDGWNEATWLRQLQTVQAHINSMVSKHANFIGTKLFTPKLFTPLHAQDLQNCLCEFDKYERARLGQGRPKQKYTYPNAPEADSFHFS